jgi:hypothetical protein
VGCIAAAIVRGRRHLNPDLSGGEVGDIYAEDPVTSRYVSLLPKTGVRDFAGPRAYHWALVAFLVSSLIVYSLLCMISPNVLIGAVKLLSNNPDAEKIAQGVPLPL